MIKVTNDPPNSSTGPEAVGTATDMLGVLNKDQKFKAVSDYAYASANACMALLLNPDPALLSNLCHTMESGEGALRDAEPASEREGKHLLLREIISIHASLLAEAKLLQAGALGKNLAGGIAENVSTLLGLLQGE